MVRRQDLVAWLQMEGMRKDVYAVRGIRNEHEVVSVCVQVIPQGLARFEHQLVELPSQK